jgi:hypothetical protein
MAVSIWGILGIFLVLSALPLSYVSTAGIFALGAGIAFLIVAVSHWAWDRWGESPDDPDLKSA